MNAPAPAAARAQLFRCEYCDAPLRDFMVFCPRCNLRLDEGQLLLRRCNILLDETGAWRRAGDVPSDVTERLMGKYRGQHDAAMSGLISRSPRFRAESVPVAAAVVAEAPAPVAPASTVEVPRPAGNPEGWVVVHIDAAAPPALPAEAPLPVAALVVPVVPPPPVAALAAAPVVSSTDPDAIPAAAPVEVVSMGADGRPRFAAPRHSTVKPQEPAEDLLFGVLSQFHLNLLASAGIFAVFVAIVLLVWKEWTQYTAITRVGLIAAGALSAMGLGALLRAKTILKTTGTSLFVIGTLAVPVVFGAAAKEHLLGGSVSVYGLLGAITSTALYSWLGRRKHFEYFRWLSIASIVAGHGFALELCGVHGGNLAPGYGLLGAALAAWAVAKRRLELHVAAAAVLCGSMIACVPFVLAGTLSPAIGLAGAAAMCAGFAMLSAIHPLWMHGAWMALGGAAAAACKSVPNCPWSAWPASVAAAGAASLVSALRKHARTEPLFPGGIVLLILAATLAIAGFSQAGEVEAHRGLLLASLLALPAVAATAWRRDEEAWAGVALLLPGAAFLSIRFLLDLPLGWLPVGLGTYAAALYVFGRRTNVFARAATPVACVAHLVAFAVACVPASLSDRFDALGPLPVYWGAKAWRVALGMALPGIALLVTRVRQQPKWLYIAEPSLLVSLVFAARWLGLSLVWMPSLVAGAALVAHVLAKGLGERFRLPVARLGAFAAIPAAITGFVMWGQPEGATALAASGALVLALGLLDEIEVAAMGGAALLSAAWCSTAHIFWHGTPGHAAGSLGFLPFAVVAPFLRTKTTRIGVHGGAFAVSAITLAFLFGSPATHFAPGAGHASLALGLLAAAALALGFRNEDESEAAGWSAAAAILATVSGAYLGLQLGIEPRYWTAASALLPAALLAAGSFRMSKSQGLPWTLLGAAGCAVFVLLALQVEAREYSIAATTLVAAVPAMLVAFRGPQKEAASGAAVVLLGLAGGCLARIWGIPAPWFAPACALVPATFTIVGAFRMRHPQGMPWVGVGIAGVAVSVALSVDGTWGSFAAATAAAAVPAMFLAFTGPWREYAAATGAALVSISAGCFANAIGVPEPWLAPACALVPCVFAFAGRTHLARPLGAWLPVGIAGLGAAIFIGASASSLSFALAASVACFPFVVLSCYGPSREGFAVAFGALACAAAAAFAHNMHAVPSSWVPVACAIVPALLTALGAYAHFIPQGKPWAAVGGAGVTLALGYSLALHSATPFAVCCLVAAAAAGSAVRFAPAILSGVAAFCFNASVASFLIAADIPPNVAAPLLVTLASIEALAASLAGARSAAHSVFAAAGALAFTAAWWAFAGPDGHEMNLVPGMISLGIAAAAASIAAIIRRQPYLWAVAGCTVVAEFYLALAHFDITTLEAYTFLPAAAVLAWTHFAARRTATVVEDTPRGTIVEAVLSQWARRLAATVHEQMATVRLLTIAAAMVPTVLLALPSAEHVHLPYALLGSGAVLVVGVLARRKTEAICGISGLVGLTTLKAVQWMIEQKLSAAWWILVVGSALIGFVAVFEIRRSWYLKGKGEAVRKVVEAYLAKWR